MPDSKVYNIKILIFRLPEIHQVEGFSADLLPCWTVYIVCSMSRSVCLMLDTTNIFSLMENYPYLYFLYTEPETGH